MSFYKVLQEGSKYQGRIGELISMNIMGYYNLLIDDDVYDFWPSQLEKTDSPPDDNPQQAA